MSDRWRLSDLIREAVRNVFGPGARLLPAVAVAGLLGASSVALLAFEQDSLWQRVDDLTAQGRGVVIFAESSPERPTQVTRESCEGLATQPGVDAAGIIVEVGRVDAAPFAVDAPIRRASTTLFPELREVDLIVGSTLASHNDLFRVLIHGQPFLAKVGDAAREGTGTALGLTAPLLPSDVAAGQCVVILDPLVDAEAVTSVLYAQLDLSGNDLTAREALNAPVDPLGDYLARLGRFAPLILGLIGGFITGILTRTRVSELAVYRLSGTSRESLSVLLAIESILIAGVTASAASAAALCLVPLLLDAATAIVAGIAMAGCWALAAILTTIDIPFQRPTDLAKDR